MRLEPKQISLLVLGGLTLLAPAGLRADVFGWRGDGTGQFPDASPPLVWNQDDNVVWKTRLPSWSNAAPVVSGERVFVTSEPNELLALDRRTGDILWKRSLSPVDLLPEEEAAPLRARIETLAPVLARAENLRGKILRLQRRMRKDPTGSQQLNELLKAAQTELETTETQLEEVRDYLPPPVPPADGYASATPVTNGSSVFVVYGTGLAAAYDFEGGLIWKRLLERPRGGEGYRASPAWAGDKLVVAINRNIRGLDPKTGKSVWRARAPEAPGSVVPVPPVEAGQAPAVASPSGYLIDSLTGTRYTDRMQRLGDNAPLPATGAILAVQRDAAAYRLPKTWKPASFEGLQAFWKMEIATGEYRASPVMAGPYLYAVTREGWLSILDAATGELLDTKLLERRTGSEFHASPIHAGGLVFLLSDDGLTRVVKPGPTYDEVGRNPLEATRSAPVAMGPHLFIRGQRFLFCLGVK